MSERVLTNGIIIPFPHRIDAAAQLRETIRQTVDTMWQYQFQDLDNVFSTTDEKGNRFIVEALGENRRRAGYHPSRVLPKGIGTVILLDYGKKGVDESENTSHKEVNIEIGVRDVQSKDPQVNALLRARILKDERIRSQIETKLFIGYTGRMHAVQTYPFLDSMLYKNLFLGINTSSVKTVEISLSNEIINFFRRKIRPLCERIVFHASNRKG